MPCKEKLSEGKEKCQFMLKWSSKSLVKTSSHSLHEENKVRVCMIPYLARFQSTKQVKKVMSYFH